MSLRYILYRINTKHNTIIIVFQSIFWKKLKFKLRKNLNPHSNINGSPEHSDHGKYWLGTERLKRQEE